MLLQVTRGKLSYCVRAREQKLNPITSVDVLTPGTCWFIILKSYYSHGLVSDSQRKESRVTYSLPVTILKRTSNLAVNAKHLGAWIHPHVSLFDSTFRQTPDVPYKTPNVSKRSLKHTGIIQTGNMGRQRPRKMSLSVCHRKLGESAVSWNHEISEYKEQPLKLETVSQKQNDKSVENKHMAHVSPDVQEEDAYSNSNVFIYFCRWLTELVKETKIFWRHC